jgi:hypothetical protein
MIALSINWGENKMKKLKRKLASIALAAVMLVSISAVAPTSAMAMSSAFAGQFYLNTWAADAEAQGTYISQIDQYYYGDGMVQWIAYGPGVGYQTGLVSSGEPLYYYPGTATVFTDWVLKTMFDVDGSTASNGVSSDNRSSFTTTPTTASTDTGSTGTTDTGSTGTTDTGSTGSTDTGETEPVEEEVVIIEVTRNDFTLALDNIDYEKGTYKIVFPEGVESAKITVAGADGEYEETETIAKTQGITLPAESGTYMISIKVDLEDGTSETFKLGGIIIDNDAQTAQIITDDEGAFINEYLHGILYR